ncbi:cilia- and flagella-associated protein 300-like isoform X2 [Leptopilina boulardi]|uniref:cilia- and flagella-associated protein 300-like isoform X2 n=1 Tax=Leptopilina boulardi TaxID=63433 RepID=UPI0021F529F8|nr:cilia- and flagella-associated protein 300-like isoform X2 [Leptopilina boulardi]
MDNISIQNFAFNESFHSYHKYQLAEAFFKDETVAKALKLKNGNNWITEGTVASSVEVKQLQCSVLNMSFFDKLKNSDNNIVYNSGAIHKRYDEEIDEFLVSDNLRAMLLNEECDEYDLYTKHEREEFIFVIFQMLVLGGILCQYEDNIQCYLDATKTIYKDLISVENQEESNKLYITTMVLKVDVKNSQGESYFPKNPSHKQNLGFLLIEPSSRQITTVLHQFN